MAKNIDAAVSANQAYDSSQIQVLKGLAAVRKRPGMYIGSTGPRGLHHLLYEIVDNSVDEALAGFCDRIEVTLEKDGSCTVRDNGRGIPVEMHPTEKVSALEVVFTVLHAGGKFGGGGYKVSGGLHGVGASVVNALSLRTRATVSRAGKLYEAEFAKGDIVRSVEEVGKATKGVTGTTVNFLPDPEIFKETVTFDFDVVASRLRQTAYLTAGLTLVLRDERGAEAVEESFCFPNGIAQMVEHFNRARTIVHEGVFHGTGEAEGVGVEIALQYTTADREDMHSFVNNIPTAEGGTHVTGFRSALTRAFNDYISDSNNKSWKSAKIEGSDLREGLTVVLSVRVSEPQFEGQTKGKLGNSEVRGAVESYLAEVFRTWFAENPKRVAVIMERVTAAARMRLAMKAARDRERKNSALESSVLPGKLADCASRDATRTEIYIVEGDSAGGTAKQGRNREFQAILPLRGKILNVEKADILRALKNKEVESLLIAIGTGYGPNFDIEKLRYGKVIIMTDADVDGAHIKTLLLTVFYRFFRELIDQGHIFVAMPPLYRVAKGKTEYYCLNDEERDVRIREFGGDATKLHITRYKGLGEMNAEQLWNSTMDPSVRTLQRVTIEDALLAEKVFEDLMGELVEPRRKFIEERAQFARLDI
jgi:DNA gyrase subunit B